MATDPPRSNRLRLIATVSNRGRSYQRLLAQNIELHRTIDRRCLRKLIRQAAAKPPQYLLLRPPVTPRLCARARSGGNRHTAAQHFECRSNYVILILLDTQPQREPH